MQQYELCIKEIEHAYAFQFNWEKIKELIMELIDTYNQFKKEIARFKERVTTIG